MIWPSPCQPACPISPRGGPGELYDRREARLDGVALDPAERVALYTGGLGQLLLRHYLRFALCLIGPAGLNDD